MPRKKSKVKLFVNGIKDRKIVDSEYNEISIDEARKLWESGLVEDFNMALQRLATRANWDWEELDRQYAEMDKARGN